MSFTRVRAIMACRYLTHATLRERIYLRNMAAPPFMLTMRFYGRSAIKSNGSEDRTPSSRQETHSITASSSLIQKARMLSLRVKEEAHHYWLGTKLLVKEIRISTRLFWKMLKGAKLTRREHTQLVRTAKDVFRLIPFAVFVIVPFMELLLPVALKLFPNMLPSTYSDKQKEEAKRRQLMASKLSLAKFLRDSIAESAVNIGPQAEAAQQFATFFKKYRISGERASTSEILEICKKFSDDLTLDNLSRPQLVTLCRFMGVNAFGTDAFLRYVLRRRLQEIKNDDKMIAAEGIDSLTEHELMTACQSRGIRSVDVEPDRLRYELQQWLDLNIKNEVPPTLLILSRALMLTEKPTHETDTAEALQTTLTSLPNEVVEEAELRLSEAQGGKVSFKKKLDIIEKEEERIADELAEDKVGEPKAEPSVPSEEIFAKLTKEQYRELGETLAALSNTPAAQKERLELEELKEDHKKLALETVVSPSKTKKKQLKELDELISEVEDYLNVMEHQRKQANVGNLITTDLQGNISTEQLEIALKMIRHPPDEDRIKKIVRKLDTDGDGRVFLKEILELADELGESEGSGDIKK